MGKHVANALGTQEELAWEQAGLRIVKAPAGKLLQTNNF